MNTPAIHQALRLEKEPDEVAWLCFPDSDLPDGINDLLRIAASPEDLIKFAEKNDLNSDELSIAIFNFIEKVMLNEKNSDEKILGINKFSTAQTRTFQYQMLMKIYHPEDSKRPGAEYYSSLINNSYQQLKTKQEHQDSISFSEQRNIPKSYHQAAKKPESQISNTKTAVAIFSVIGICSLVAMTGKFYGNADVESFADNNEIQNIVQDTSSDKNKLIKVISVKSDNVAAPEIQSIQATSAVLQDLLKELEVAYEDGNVDVIKPILANAPDLKDQTEKQLNDKLETIFEITSERKMVLFDFNWTSTSGVLEGKGKFLSRYQLAGENKWLTREGIANVTAQKNNNELKVSQLILENHDIE